MFTTKQQVTDFLNSCAKSRKMSPYELKKWATAFPDDQIYMGHAVVVRLHMDELVELIRWVEEDERE